MLRFISLFSGFMLIGSVLGENLVLRTELFMQKSGSVSDKKINEVLESPSTGKVFSASVTSAASATASVSLINCYQDQVSGFSVRISSGKIREKMKNYRISSDISWNFAEEGPYLASGTESFYEGTRITSVRNLLPETFSPLEIVKSKNAERVYVPAVVFTVKGAQKEKSVFRRGREKEWEIVLRIEEEGKTPVIFRLNPVYHHRTFPTKTEPGGIQCRMYDFKEQGKITVMNLVYCRQRGMRKDGNPVLEQISLSLSFEAPGKGSVMQLADLTSFCSDGTAAYGKLPQDGGRRIRYQVFLHVGNGSENALPDDAFSGFLK